MNRLIRNIKYRLNIILAFIYLQIFQRNLLKKDIWLISEKRTEARDNGYHLFKYLCENVKDIMPVYVMDTKRPDYRKIDGIGTVIQYDSFTHFVYYLAAHYRVGCQIQGGKPFIDVGKQSTLKCLRKKGQIHFFIKHGIAKDDIPESYDFRLAGYDVMFCGARKEYDYYKRRYKYPDDRIKCPGLCRFDKLITCDNTEKILLIMPTYRKWLVSHDSSSMATKEEIAKFVNSDYYHEYIRLLTDNDLIQYLKTEGYRLVFYPHYTMQPFLSAFFDIPIDTDVIKIASREKYDVQDLLIKSKILITDYSSVFFDFGYMKKPVIFFQFDSEKYRKEHYSTGWFDYRKDGFGEVIENKEQLVTCIKSMIEMDGKIEPEYLRRIESCFCENDNNNCLRVYQTIREY